MKTATEQMKAIKKTSALLAFVSIVLLSIFYPMMLLQSSTRGNFQGMAFLGSVTASIAVSLIVVFLYERRRITEASWEQDFLDRTGWRLRNILRITGVVILVVGLPGGVGFMAMSIFFGICFVFIGLFPWMRSDKEVEAWEARKLEKNEKKYLSGCVITRNGNLATIVLKGVRINGLLYVALLTLVVGALLVISVWTEMSDPILSLGAFIIPLFGLVALAFFMAFYIFSSRTLTMRVDRVLNTCALVFTTVFKVKYRTITLSLAEIRTVVTGGDFKEALSISLARSAGTYVDSVNYIYLFANGKGRITLLRVPESSSNYNVRYLDPIASKIKDALIGTGL
jgi:MFS family permease